MQHNNIQTVYPIEKIISILSYISMGIIGLVIMLIANAKNKKMKYFLNYNIVQSVIIGVVLAIFKYTFDFILTIFSHIKFLDYIAAMIYYLFSFKIIRIYSLNISFTALELLVFILLVYIITGVVLGRIFYVPFLSDVLNKAVKRPE